MTSKKSNLLLKVGNIQAHSKRTISKSPKSVTFLDDIDGGNLVIHKKSKDKKKITIEEISDLGDSEKDDDFLSIDSKYEVTPQKKTPS